VVARLLGAGISEEILRIECERAVRIAQRLPDEVKGYERLAERAKAAMTALNTLRSFYNELHDGPEGFYRPMDERDEALDQLDNWEPIIAGYQTVDLAELGVRRQAHKPRAPLRVAVGTLSKNLTQMAQGFPNDEWVSTLANALFTDTIVAPDARRWRRSVEGLPWPVFERWLR
jgi:hypothetical protein